MKEETITINGNRPVEILNSLGSVIEAYESTNKEMTKFFVIFKTPQPIFSVGMRVVLKKERRHYTHEMVYRLLEKDPTEVGDDFKVMDDNGETRFWNLQSLSEYFTPYEKPEVGDDFWFISPRRNFSQFWIGNENDNALWNLGLAFKTKEQAEFARERLSKLF